MNKISDLKVGDEVMTNFYGKGIVYEITDKWVLLIQLQFQLPCPSRPTFCNHEINWQKTNELNNKQMKEFIIECPSGFEVDKEKSTFEKIVFKAIENKLPMSVEEIPNRNWFLTHKLEDYKLSTKERAEAFLALMQLVELRDAWNGDSERHQFLIPVRGGDSHSQLISFKNSELRNKFEIQFKDLIEQAKELL